MLALDRVTAAYGATIVLRDISLVVPAATVVALLGPNGAGKTTLLRASSGLLRPRSGRVLVDDVDVTALPGHRMREAGVCHITEGRSIFPSLTVRENLLMFSPHGDESASLELAVDSFPRLSGRLNQIAGTMSGGEQQMLALARAYIGNPKVILLDEVSMGLAPRIVDEIMVFLARLASQGVSLLIVEQYVEKALQLADYVYVLRRGGLCFAGDPSELEDQDLFAHYLGV